ncbi:hypothetical protein ACFW2D_17985 [Streptomyces sp. NPDC058914]|uniref:hypothetical protein n=1 Tax=Streptomyces sp. NPDC058914 TaxID=3346671 RepID=UPI0036780007
MRTIVAGRIVASETEYIEAAVGVGVDLAELCGASRDLRAEWLEFLEETSDPTSEIDRQNIAYLRRVLGVRPKAAVVPLPRRGTARLASGTEVRAA